MTQLRTIVSSLFRKYGNDTKAKAKQGIEQSLMRYESKKARGHSSNDKIIPSLYSAQSNGVLQAKPIVDYDFETSKYKSDELLVGVELEVTGRPMSDYLDKVLKEFGPGYVCVDGSVPGGVEIVLAPRPLSVWRLQYGGVREALNLLSRVGCRSHQTSTCGLHFHIGYCSTFKRTHAERLRTFVVRNTEWFTTLSRRTRVPGGRRSDDPTYFCRFEDNANSRYRAVNLCPSETCEIRFFRGTLNAESFIGALECVHALARFAASPGGAYCPSLDEFKTFFEKEKYNYLSYIVKKLFPLPVIKRPRTKEEKEHNKRLREEKKNAKLRALGEEAQVLIAYACQRSSIRTGGAHEMPWGTPPQEVTLRMVLGSGYRKELRDYFLSHDFRIATRTTASAMPLDAVVIMTRKVAWGHEKRYLSIGSLSHFLAGTYWTIYDQMNIQRDLLEQRVVEAIQARETTQQTITDANAIAF